MSLLETIKIRDNFRLRKKVLGFKKFAVEVMGGWFPSKDPELRDGVLQTRVIDKENNKYIHIVRDYLSGKELHKEDEKLTDHTI
ncbi:MAG: hypothetical protein GW809_07760 [Bacteroidetes bacterium]|nr:hypothetical protein [Bacteroidota bacterium]